MNLTDSPFLCHALPMLLLFWLIIGYISWKKEKARKRAKRLRAKEKQSQILYHRYLELFHS